MAKKEKEVKKEPAKKMIGGEPSKYGVGDLAQMLDLDPATVRVKLRGAKVKKLGRGGASYGWDTKDDLKAVADQISAKAKKEEKPAKEKAPAKTEKAPAKEKASAKKDAPAKDTKKAANDKGAKKSGKKAA